MDIFNGKSSKKIGYLSVCRLTPSLQICVVCIPCFLGLFCESKSLRYKAAAHHPSQRSAEFFALCKATSAGYLRARLKQEGMRARKDEGDTPSPGEDLGLVCLVSLAADCSIVLVN